jgi:hypothetical protein
MIFGNPQREADHDRVSLAAGLLASVLAKKKCTLAPDFKS